MEISKGKLVLLVVLVLAAAVGIWKFVLPLIGPTGGGGARAIDTANDRVLKLAIAMENYANSIGAYPTGDEAAIATALTTPGTTPAGVDYPGFYTPAGSEINSAGQLVDPWGTPIRFTFDNDRMGMVTSAGPDKQFDTGDDLDASFER